LPTPFWIYVAAILSGTFGFLPPQSPVYFFIERRVLPATLVLMLIGTPLRQLLKMGGKSLTAMAIAAGTMMIAVFVSYAALVRLLPEEAWKGCGALLGTWIGGSANMLAVKQILNMSEDGFAPLIVIDTILSYTWLAFLLAGARYQEKFDRPFKNIAAENVSIEKEITNSPSEKQPARIVRLILMLALAFGVGEAMVRLGAAVNESGFLFCFGRLEREVDDFDEKSSGQLVMSEEVINAHRVLIVLRCQTRGGYTGQKNTFHARKGGIRDQILNPARERLFVLPRQSP
jgi:uncharacterized membrane protein